jgi:hypothetical protein
MGRYSPIRLVPEAPSRSPTRKTRAIPTNRPTEAAPELTLEIIEADATHLCWNMFREILELLRRLFWLSVEWHWRSCYSGLQGCLTILLFWALALTFAFWLFAGYLALIGRLASTSSGLVTVCYNLVGAAISFTEYIVELNEI